VRCAQGRGGGGQHLKTWADATVGWWRTVRPAHPLELTSPGRLALAAQAPTWKCWQASLEAPAGSITRGKGMESGPETSKRRLPRQLTFNLASLQYRGIIDNSMKHCIPE